MLEAAIVMALGTYLVTILLSDLSNVGVVGSPGRTEACTRMVASLYRLNWRTLVWVR